MYAKGSLADDLRAFFSEYGQEESLVSLMKRIGVKFQEFHYD